MNIASWVDTNLERFGDYEALVFEGRTWTNLALAERSARLAGALVALGVAPGDRVVVVLPNSPELVVAFPAILRAGGVVVLVHPGASAAEISRVANHAEAVAIITTTSIATYAPNVRVKIVVGEAFERLLETSAPLAQPVERDDTAVAQIAYTAGTTGTPKGVVYTHATLTARLRFLAAQQNRRDANAPMVLLAVLPMGHAFGTIPLFYRLVLRSKLVCLAAFEPRAVFEAIARHRVEFAPLVPAMCEALLASPELGRHDLSSLRSIAVGGAPVSAGLADRVEAAFKFRPTVSYGMTELPGITFNTGNKPGSVGRLIPGVASRIVDEQGQDRPPGQIGEILLKAPWMSDAYYGQASTKLRDGWLHTGDLGYFDADRDLFIVGRNKELIIQAGNNVYPQEVIDVLATLEGVRECAVVGVPNELLGEEVVACVVGTVTSEAVIAHCRAHLDPRKTPVRVHFVDELPKTDLGKVKVHVLRAQIERARAGVHETELVRALRAATPGARRDLLREAIEARLRGVLRRDVSADPRATFGELGLDSLGAVELSNAIGISLGRSLSPTLTFSRPTVAALTDHVLEELFGVATTRVHVPAPIGEREPIAVIGVGCRLPGGVATPEQLWQLLESGVDASSEIDRWDMDAIYDPIRGTAGKTYTRRASLLDAPEMFQADFFDLTPREARDLDPQHRLLLETTWEAFEHAGRDPLGQHDARAGVFVGISGSSYPGGGLGVQPAMAPGRVSYFFDLDGPAFAVDTACSSSLVAIHNAVTSLRRGECDLALAGGVNVMCAPEAFIGLSAIQALAPDGRCKAFDASADGFGRGEGCVMFVLRRLHDAIADEDRVLGVIRGTALNHDGRSSSLTAPNGKAQEAVIRAALADAGVNAGEVDYLEAHGTGTPLGDPIEVQAATAVLGDSTRRLAIGSVKTNIGHLEAAAGAAGVLKVLLAFEHDRIPATLHQHRLNPMLESFADKFVVASSALPWPRTSRVAAVTSLGMSGTNAHAILEAPPVAAPTTPAVEHAQLLCLSARTETALAQLARRYAEALPLDATLADVCYTAAVGRAQLPHRLAIVASDREGMIERLRDAPSKRAPARPPKIGFMFTGQGAQYVGMGRRLYETHPVYRHAIQRCSEIAQPLLPRPLLDVLFGEPRDGELCLDDTALAQPALFALEWSLAQVWRAWGIEPAFVLGHSLGELVAACVAGVFDVEAGLRLAAERGRLMQALPRDGAMVALAGDEATVRAAIGARAARVAISALNGPEAVVLSGETDAVAAVVADLAGMRARTLRVSHAFHSPLMDPILDAFERMVAAITLAPPAIALISTVDIGAEVTTPAYWRRQIREPVRFGAAVQAMVAAGAELVVEIGPNPTLIAMAQQNGVTPRAWIGSLRRDRDDWDELLTGLGELYTHGIAPCWDEVWRDSRKVVLPTYPFERRRYWSAPRSTRAIDAAPAIAQEPPRVALLRELAAMPLDERVHHVTNHMRSILARVLGRAPESLAIDRDLLDDGVDSLRVMDMLGGLRQRLGLELSPAELTARPTLAAFAAYAASRIAGPVAATTSLIAINPRGDAIPIYCMHPSGGDVTAYLGWRALLGDDQPLYAVQSHETEHATLLAMASAYADLVQGNGPSILVGWSMGGVTAHAVAAELERRGEPVALVGVIDSNARRETASELQQIALALSGVIYDLGQPAPEVLDGKLRQMFTARIARDQMLAWCEANGLIAPNAVSAERFDRMMQLRFRHFDLVGEHPRGIVKAPMRVWWAERELGDWAPHTEGGAVAKVLGGNHFTVIRPPRVETIVAELRAIARAR